MTSKKKITAADLMKKLRSDPDFVAKRQQADQELAQRTAELRQAEAPLLNDLRAAGYIVDSVWQLVNTAASYSSALPLLLEHLQREYPVPVREGIARALAVPQARFAWDTLINLYRAERDPRAKGGLAVALGVIADDELIDDVIALALDSQHGETRAFLLGALERSTDPKASTTLMQLRSDAELADEVRTILRRRKRPH